MALSAVRTPDILVRPSIPLSAVDDGPVLDAPRPPVSASNNQDDLAAGNAAKEITPEELAIAAAQRKGDPETAAIKEDDGGKKATTDDGSETDEAFDDGITPPNDLPMYANREISKIRRQARERVEAILAASKEEIGSEKWDAAYKAANAKVVGDFTAQVRRAEKAAAEAKAEADRLAKELSERAAPQQTEAEAEPAPRPDRYAFDNPEEYDAALIAWTEGEAQRKFEIKTKAEAKTAAEAKAEADRLAAEATLEEARVKAEAEAQEIASTWRANEAAALERHPDYQEVVYRTENPPNITQAMAACLFKLPGQLGVDVAYHLATDTDRCDEIANQPTPLLQALELGRLANQIEASQRPARRVVKQPIEPVNTQRSGDTEVNPDEESMDAYFRRRNAQLQRNHRPFFPSSEKH